MHSVPPLQKPKTRRTELCREIATEQLTAHRQ